MDTTNSSIEELKSGKLLNKKVKNKKRTGRIRSRFLTYYLIPKNPISKKEIKILGVLPFVIILGLWSVLTFSGVLSTFFLPTPIEVINSLWNMLAHQQFLMDIGSSVFRIIVGYIIAAVLAVPLGILMGSYSAPRSFFEPIIGVIRYLPVTALIPLFILWMGIGESEKIAVIFFGTFFPLVFMIMDVSSNISKDLINVSYTLGANKIEIFTKVLVPACMPNVVENLRTVLGWTWTYLIVAELVAADNGIGHVIMNAQRYLKTDQIIAGIVTIGALGFISDQLFKLLYRRLFPYVINK